MIEKTYVIALMLHQGYHASINPNICNIYLIFYFNDLKNWEGFQ